MSIYSTQRNNLVWELLISLRNASYDSYIVGKILKANSATKRGCWIIPSGDVLERTQGQLRFFFLLIGVYNNKKSRNIHRNKKDPSTDPILQYPQSSKTKNQQMKTHLHILRQSWWYSYSGWLLQCPHQGLLTNVQNFAYLY